MLTHDEIFLHLIQRLIVVRDMLTNSANCASHIHDTIVVIYLKNFIIVYTSLVIFLFLFFLVGNHADSYASL